jgi:hypothetical protein
MRKPILIPILLLVLAVPVVAQESAEQGESTRPAKPAEEETDREVRVERVRKILGLPQAAEEARDAGVPEEEVSKVLEAARARRVPAEEVRVILEAETESVREHGHIDNFGAFVQSMLDQGLRGRELAAAIHREHAAHGKGKHGKDFHPGAKGKGKKPGKHEGHERKVEHEDDHDHGKPGKARDTRPKKK